MLSQGLLKRKESEMYEYEYVMGRTDSRQAAAKSCVLNSASPLKHDNDNMRYKGLLFNEAPSIPDFTVDGPILKP